jgi:hypothetical protein
VLEASDGGVFALDGTPLVCNKDVVVNPSFVAVADRSVDWLKYFSAP